MSQEPEEPKPSEPDGEPERPKYTPPSYVPPVSLDKDRDNPTEPIPPAPQYPQTEQPHPGQQPYTGAQGQPAAPSGQAPYGQAPAPYGQSQYGQAPYNQTQYNPMQYNQAQYNPGYAQYAYGPPEPKGLSIASMVCGISVFLGFGFFVLPQIAAVVLGHMGLSREPAGRGMALAGLIMGYVGIALTIAFIVFFVVVLGVASNSGRYSY